MITPVKIQEAEKPRLKRTLEKKENNDLNSPKPSEPLINIVNTDENKEPAKTHEISPIVEKLEEEVILNKTEDTKDVSAASDKPLESTEKENVTLEPEETGT